MEEDNDIGVERSRGERNAVTRRISDTIKTDDEITENREEAALHASE